MDKTSQKFGFQNTKFQKFRENLISRVCENKILIDEDIVNLKNDHDFWILCAKNVKSTKFHWSILIISKIKRPSVFQFSVLKGTPEGKLFTDDVTIEI